jgi:hypothetical protein
MQKSYITKSYIGFYSKPEIIEKLKNLKDQSIIIENNYYVYVDIDKISNKDRLISQLYNILHDENKNITINYLEKILNKRPKRYVKIVDYMNPLWINEIKKLKKEYEKEKKDKIPLLH